MRLKKHKNVSTDWVSDFCFYSFQPQWSSHNPSVSSSDQNYTLSLYVPQSWSKLPEQLLVLLNQGFYSVCHCLCVNLIWTNLFMCCTGLKFLFCFLISLILPCLILSFHFISFFLNHTYVSFRDCPVFLLSIFFMPVMTYVEHFELPCCWELLLCINRLAMPVCNFKK